MAYSYLADTDLVEKTEFKDGSGGGGAVAARAQRQFEAERALLDYVENKWLTGGTVTVSQYDYANNDLNLRTNVDHTGTAFAATQPSVAYDYNDRQELIEAQRTGAGANVWTYEYDPIGNRTASTLDDPSESADYESATNGLNQYANIRTTLASTWTLQGYRYDLDGNLIEGFIAADMNCSGEVDFFDLDAFALALLDPEGYATEYPGCDPRNGDVNGDGELDFFDIDRFVEIALDGGSGLRFAYKWDAENRLIEAGPATTPVNDDIRVTFAYDYLGRRVEKKVEEYQSSSWSTTLHRKFVYDGWHLLLELDAANSNAIVRKYTWGLDLAGQNGSLNDRTSAGGIGGLLACNDPGASKNYYYFYDANGNVGQLIDASDGSLDAKYEYDPYGGTINQSGVYAAANPFRFSTKYLHDEIGWYDFGMRLYGPRWGRWGSRDPLQEAGGLNLQAFVRNRPTDSIDPLGLQSVPATQSVVDKSKACCRYEVENVTTTAGPVYGGIFHSLHKMERTKACDSCHGTPEQCCTCQPARVESSSSVSWSSTNTKLLKARWGACCSCRVQVRRQNIPTPVIGWMTGSTYGSHVRMVIKCPDGKRWILEHGGAEGKPVPNHVSETPLNADNTWIGAEFTIMAGGSPRQEINYCVPCDEIPTLLQRGKSFDGCIYNGIQDCHWFIRGVMSSIGVNDGDPNDCPPIP